MLSVRRGSGSSALVALAVTAIFGILGSSLQLYARPDKQSRQETRPEKAVQKENESPYKNWVQEEVPYIITAEERQAFNKLTTDGERERFIESFWERRNPNPGSRENEFKEEYYRRVAYANEHFASGIPGPTEVPSGRPGLMVPGWKTDRGKIYIMYGPPNEIDSHSGGAVPFEDWSYKYIDGIGNNVKLEFVDPTLRGEYHLTLNPREKDELLHVPPLGRRQVP